MAINMNAVQGLYNHYHSKVKTNPNLYTNSRDKNRAVLVVLPKELLDYANRSSGHSGFGAGARPVGIRKVVSDAKSSLSEIFSSVESLKSFILSSECDAEAYIAEVKERHLKGVSRASRKVSKPSTTTIFPMVKDVFHDYYPHALLRELTVKYGKEEVANSWNHLWINEFEMRYGISA